MGRVDDELAVDAADAHGAERAGERDVGNQSAAQAPLMQRMSGSIFAVGAEEHADDLRVVEVALREERTQRAVGHAAGEDFLFGRTAFALEVAAGEFAGGGGFFAVVDGEREQVLAFLDLGGGDGGDEDDGVAERTVTAPSASLASLPVSMVMWLVAHVGGDLMDHFV